MWSKRKAKVACTGVFIDAPDTGQGLCTLALLEYHKDQYQSQLLLITIVVLL